MSLYWRELLKMFPHAKVLLTVRDPVKWYNSVKNTIREIHRFRVESTLAAPVRILGKLTGIMKGPALYTCMAPTYLGNKYPGGLFGALDAGRRQPSSSTRTGWTRSSRKSHQRSYLCLTCPKAGSHCAGLLAYPSLTFPSPTPMTPRCNRAGLDP